MGLAERAVRGVFGFGVIDTVRYALSFLVQIFLARLLTPDAFGIVALAVTLQTFTTLVLRWGIPQALMQEGEEYMNRFSTIFWINISFTVLLLLLITAGSPLLFLYFEDIVVEVFFILLFSNGIRNVALPFQAAIQREFDLSQLAAINLVSLLISSIIGVWLAMTGMGVWSLAIYYSLRDILSGFGYILFSPKFPSLTFSRQTARWFSRFAVEMFKSRALISVEAQGDDYLVGTLAGTSALGLYNLGWRLATAFHSVVHPAIREGIMPTFAKLKDTTSESRKGIEFLIRMQLSLAVPAYVFAALTAPTLIMTIFGSQWINMVPVFQILCFAGILFPLLGTGRQVYYAWGKPNTMFRLQLVYVAVLIGGLLLFIPRLGAVGAAVAINLSLLVGCLLVFARLKTDVNLSLSRLFVPYFFAGILALFSGVIAKHTIFPESNSVLLSVIPVGVLVGLVFFSSVYILARDEVIEDLTVLRESFLAHPDESSPEN